MVTIQTSLDTESKLSILSQDSQYDLACSCGTNDSERRHRSGNDKWIYPVSLPERRETTFLFKTLVSNVCVNNCRYCPLRVGKDPRRCTLEAGEIVKLFFEYLRKKKVIGIFLSSGVVGNPDRTMDRIIQIARLIRRRSFRGYIHLKIIPGASPAAIEEAVSLATSVSLNIETAGNHHFEQLCSSKKYISDVIEPIKQISKLTAKGGKFSRVKQNTQFVVGAAAETDKEIVDYSWGLYKRLGLNRVYFSAYQTGLGEKDLPGELALIDNRSRLMREHRLYEVDWLIRKYGFSFDEICFDEKGNLDLTLDPKEVWAKSHPKLFPINVNTASRDELLRVPGFGEITVNHILRFKKERRRLSRLEDIGKVGKRLKKAAEYVKFC